jgi:hypothetical protein
LELSSWSSGVVLDELKPVMRNPADSMPVFTKRRDSFHTAPGYREVAVEYSCIPDSMYPWDPFIMKEINRFAPDAIPMWVRWAFRSPEEYEDVGTVVYGRHALGRHIEHLSSDIDRFQCPMPEGVTFKKPNRIWFIHEGPHPTDEYVDLPGDYLPFDHSIYSKAVEMAEGFKQTLAEFKASLYDQFISAADRAKTKRRAAIADDMEMRSRAFHSYADKLMENVSDVEIGEYNRTIGKGR